MSKIITFTCKNPTCSNTTQAVTQNDDHPDIVPGRISNWLCTKCEKRAAELETRQKKAEQTEAQRKAEHEKRKKQWLQTLEGQKWLQEQQAENSRQITELSQMLNEYERKQTQYQQTLQEELNKLQNSPKNTKIKGLEAKIKESQEETERIRQQIQELEANYQEKLTQLDQEFAESSELTNEISFSDNQLGQCASCDKKLQEGEQYFYYPQDPEKRAICTTCKPQVDNAIWAAQQILQGKQVDLNSLNLHPQHTTHLKAMQQIIAGQEINIENLPLEEEGKQELRMIQQQIKSQQPIPLPDNSSPSVLEDYQPPTNQPQKICASCSREIPIGQGYFRYKDEGTNICTNCYKCFTCQRSLENQQLIYHLDNNLTKANCADCHWKQITQKQSRSNPSTDHNYLSCTHCVKKIASGETYYIVNKNTNLCANCQEKRKQKFGLIGGLIGLSIGLIFMAIYYYWKNRKDKGEKEDKDPSWWNW